MGNPLADALADYRTQLTTPSGADRSRPRRRWRWWLIVALTVVVLLAGAWLALRPTPVAAPPATPGGPVVVPELADPVSPPSPAPAPTGAAALAVAPAARWTTWQSALVRTWRPVVDGGGPSDPPAAGFTHTPQGALVAAATLLSLAYYAPRQEWTALADTRVVWAPGQREQLAAELAPVWADPPAASQLTPLGYRVVSYADDHAQFRLWWQLAVPAATVGALVDVVWADSDWKLFFDESAMDLRGITGTDSYLPWGPA